MAFLCRIALTTCLTFTLCCASADLFAGEAGNYPELVLADEPVVYWRFNESAESKIVNRAELAANEFRFDGTVVGRVLTERLGPESPSFPLFGEHNRAVGFSAKNSYIRIEDTGEESLLDFDVGDSITIEAWVNPRLTGGHDYHYIIGKGRTQNSGFAADNQNWALRLKSPAGQLSFLFRSRGEGGDWHRWTSRAGIGGEDGWHHVAVSYTFGKKDSLVGYIDGKPVKGVWDKAGATDRAPIVDNDEIRIGSTYHGAAAFGGELDEVAVYRKILPPERIGARYEYDSPGLRPINWDEIPDGQFQVEIFEGLPDRRSWDFRPPRYIESYATDTLAFVAVPNKYNQRGIQIDRSNPFLIRAAGTIHLPEGSQQILLRARNAARLYLDGEKIAETDFHSIPSSGHGRVVDVDTDLAPNIRPRHRGETEAVAQVQGDGERHQFHFEMIVGGQRHRPEMGETSVSVAAPGEDFRLMSESQEYLLTDAGWTAFAHRQRAELISLNSVRRREAGAKEAEHWKQRHAAAAEVVKQSEPPKIPAVADESAVRNSVDRFINARLAGEGIKPAELVDDEAFLRRVTLDLIGTIPTEAQIAEFQADQQPGRRSRAIDRLLNDPGWADNWMGYWQDVLAENPALVKPKLNNSGPFRWWLYESFLDNKPFDRFATELIRMEGSRRYGGPAGFAVATQNDVPMAAKAQILGRAFLGLNMTCARCHDAPFHDYQQKDLFSLAAMLRRQPLRVPKTSSIPGGDEVVSSMIVEVTLKPGSLVAPRWTFSDVVSTKVLARETATAADSRERLASLLTSPHNSRFAEVIVNRMWKRYLGRGLVEPVDDWHQAEPSHPGLLQYLAREFVLHGYDLKHLARLILNSHTYQRGQPAGESDERHQELFAASHVRRMTAEQVVDSMFAAAGKQFNAGQLCLDPDGAMKLDTAINLGVPTRAWEFSSLSNERDRPSLALPFAQPFVTTLETFGWRSSRQNPLTDRDVEPTVRQPAVIANGILSRRVTRLSDDSGFTALALEEQPLPRLVDRVYLRLLSRRPSADERETFVELLKEGYDRRITEPPQSTEKPKRLPLGLVSWSNHLSERANAIKIELQRAVEQGDPPTAGLDSDWRERLEDMLWALINSPEFVYLP